MIARAYGWGAFRLVLKVGSLSMLLCGGVACEQQGTTPTAKGAAAYTRGDYGTALNEFQRLAEAGNTTAQFNLGVMYANGHGVIQNYAEALKLYLLAADKRDVDAQNNIGTLYLYGCGVPQDKVRAYIWFNLAASAPNAGDAEPGIKNRAIVSGSMTDAQINQAHELSQQCSRQNYKGCNNLVVRRPALTSTTPERIATPRAPAPRVSANNRHAIPLRSDRGTFVVSAKINDMMSFQFTVDSGALGVAIPEEIFLTLRRIGAITKDDILSDQRYIIADGGTAPRNNNRRGLATALPGARFTAEGKSFRKLASGDAHNPWIRLLGARMRTLGASNLRA
jgi:hypothetical protein